MDIKYSLLSGLVKLISRLPLRMLYVLSDGMYFLVYHIVRYRRRVVRDNLVKSFPEKTHDEILRTEKEFYSFFCDYIVETIKLSSMSSEEMKRRMRIIGVDTMVHDLETEGKLFGFIYLAHYGNWEWVSSLAEWIHDEAPDYIAGQIYRPLRNKTFNKLFLQLRGRFGAVSIPMKETLRFVVGQRQAGRHAIIGFISDQGPWWSSIHHWTQFLNRKTAVFTGTERIGRRVGALFYYAHVTRIRRGYYECRIARMIDDIGNYPDCGVTDRYMSILEETIKKQPSIWLWTHKRWKRTYEDYLKRVQSGKHEPESC